MSIIKIKTGVKGFNGKIYKNFYQCYSGRRTDYHYRVFSCTDKGEQYIKSAGNLKSAMIIFDKALNTFKEKEK